MRLLLTALFAATTLHAETGLFIVHMMLHAIGEERYEIATSADGLTLSTSYHYADRGLFDDTVTASLTTAPDYTPRSIDLKGSADRGPGERYTAHIEKSRATVEERAAARAPSPRPIVICSSPDPRPSLCNWQ
ncbi:MAG: hypothetical protein WDO73_03585 [Ignavibacteriota bacterium]